MLASPFAFFRGAAAIMAARSRRDAAVGPARPACGDAHLSNFGGFASPERELVFDINDFDETLPGPWEWDVKRLAASVEIAGARVGLQAGQRARVVLAPCASYREAMREFAACATSTVWYSQLDVDGLAAAMQTHGATQDARGSKRGSAKAMTQGQHAGARQADAAWSTASRGSSATRR